MSETEIIYILAVILVVILVLFKDKIKDLVIKLPGGASIKIGMDTDPIQNNLNRLGISVVLIDVDHTNTSLRDVVISSFTSLKELIFSLARHNNIDVSSQTPINLLNILLSEKAIPVALAEPIRELYTLGEQVFDQPKARIPEQMARNYVGFVASIEKYVRNELLTTQSGGVEPKEEMKKTKIGSPGFSSPKVNQPAAVLHAIAGSVQGQRFPIDKSMFRIGANSRNDLVIPDDTYVSGHHATISYDNGNLNLIDDQSTNGTFLNNQRLSNRSSSLRIGDEIKMGSSVFKVE